MSVSGQVASGTQLLSGIRNGTNQLIRRNGATIGSTSFVGQSVVYNTIGARLSGNEYHNDLIGEILVFNRALLDSEVSAVESYIMTKWGIS
jgi:hypothetical protein